MKRIALALLGSFALFVGVAPLASSSTLEREYTFTADQFAVRIENGVAVVDVRGAQAEDRAGHPDLPWLAERVELPDGERVSGIEILALETAPLAGSVRMASAIRPQPASLAIERTMPDAEIYSRPGFQPTRPIELGIQGYEAGDGVAMLRLWPVRWDAVSGKLERVSRVRVRLTLVADTGHPLKRERVGAPWLVPRARLGAPTGAPRNAAVSAASLGGAAQPFQATQLPSLLGSPVQYVIITSDELAPQLQRLADWKTQSGTPAVVRTLSFIQQNYVAGTDDADRVRQFIRDAYQRWGTQYVLLGGDTDVMPLRKGFSTFNFGGTMIPTDLYFQCLDGNWNADGDSLYGEGWRDTVQVGDSCDVLPDVWLGRAPISNLTQAQQFVDKTLQYEKTPVGDYENGMLFFSEVLFPQNWSPGMFTFLDGAQLTEDVLPSLDANPAYHVARLYENFTDPRWRPGALQELKHVVVDSLNRGYNIAIHTGHGYRNVMSCGDDNMSNNDAAGLTNGNRLFNLYSIDCTSNAIDFPCLGEAFMHSTGGGAVTNIGSTEVDFPTTGRYVQVDFFRMVFHDSMSTIGQAFVNQKLATTVNAANDNVNRWTIMTMLLLGDPELRIWTARPRTLTVVAPSSITVADSQVTVQVSIAGVPLYGARVTLYRPDDDFSTGTTNGAGSITLPFRPDTLGTMTLTVTGYDCRPVQQTVNIVANATRSAFDAQTPVLTDGGAAGLTGNVNGLLDAGEVIDLRVPLRNTGGASATSVTGTLTTTDPLVVISSPTISYGTIAAGALKTTTGAFRVSVPYTMPDQREIPFVLTVLASGSRHSTCKFQLVVHGPDLASFSHTVVDLGGNANGRPDPGESVSEFISIRNVGTGIAQGVTMVLRSLDGLATITDSTASFGDLVAGQEKSGDAVVFTASSAAAQFELRFFDSYGFLGSQQLDISYPIIPSWLSATGIGNAVELTWGHSAEPDLIGYNIYQATAPAGPFTRVNAVPSDRTSYFRVSNAQPLTTYYFRVAAVDSSGNESGQSDLVPVITNPPNHAVFPIQMGNVTPSSVAVDHLYPNYYMDIVAGAGVLYLWHPDGTAPVDADGQGTTYGDFTTRGKYYAAGPAIADLDGDGVREVVAATWDSAQVYVFDQAGQVKPGWPRQTGAVWSSPTIADLDNSGKQEIIFGSNSPNFYVFRGDGTEWRDGDSNPSTTGIFKVLAGGFNPGTAAVAPLENNGITDIIFGDDAGWLYAWRPDGSNVPGFPVQLGVLLRSSPAVGYLDGPGDSQLEIVITAQNDSLYVIEANGARRTGFPVHVKTTGNTRQPSPALADMDRDGFLDIVEAATDGGLYVFDRSGGIVSPWNGVRFSILSANAIESSPVVADIDGDGWPDIVVGGEDAALSAFSGATAQLLPGFPIPVPAEIRGTPALCDCDQDGKTEIILADWDGSLYMWDYDMPFSPSVAPPWPQFHHDARHTGFASAPAFLDAPPPVVALPSRLEFAPLQPNPSRNGTVLAWGVPADQSGAPYDVAIFDLGGRRVRTLAHGIAKPGRYSMRWDLRGDRDGQVSAGVYFARIALGSHARSQKLVVLR